MTQVLTVFCKLKVSASQATKLDATLDAFAQACQPKHAREDNQRSSASVSERPRNPCTVWAVQQLGCAGM